MASEPETEHIDDGLVCWVCQFAECDDHPEEPLLSTGCACCRRGSSGGRAHVSCLASAAVHKRKLWNECPTCKQLFTGAVGVELSRARWELCRSDPEANGERMYALRSLADSLSDSGDDAAARPLLEELVAVARRTRGSDHAFTLDAIGRLGTLLSQMDDDAGAQTLLEEAVAGLRLTLGLGDESNQMLGAMSRLASVHLNLNATAKARLLFEGVLATLRRTNPASPNTLRTICNLGRTLYSAGDITAGFALHEEAAASALQELGPEHPCTQQLTDALAGMRQKTATFPSGTRAAGPWLAWSPSQSSTACRHTWSALTWARADTTCATKATRGQASPLGSNQRTSFLIKARR